MSAAPAASSQAPEPSRLAAAAAELIRARAALDAEPEGELTYYRLRDLALASVDLTREMLRAAGVTVGEDMRSVVDGMSTLVGDDREVIDAMQTLVGLTNAHVLAFMPRPPTRPLVAGRAAGVVVAAFVDAILGDDYRPRSG